MTVRCLLIDDEPLALKVLENYIGKLDWLEVAGSCLSPIEGFEVLKTKKIDLLFLDIQMPELSGLEFIRTLTHPPKVILTTAYRQFAADAFELDVLDYLLKPISFPRFVAGVNRFLDWQTRTKDLAVPQVQIIGERRSFYIRKGKEMIRLFPDEILYIESLKDYVQIHLGIEKHIYKARISDMEEELTEDQFIRIHKSFLINISRIRSVSPNEINIDGIKIPIGRSYKNLVHKKLGIC